MALINFLKKKKEQIDKAIPNLNVRQRAAQAVQSVGKTVSNIERASQQAGLRARQQVNRTIQNIPQPTRTIPVDSFKSKMQEQGIGGGRQFAKELFNLDNIRESTGKALYENKPLKILRGVADFAAPITTGRNFIRTTGQAIGAGIEEFGLRKEQKAIDKENEAISKISDPKEALRRSQANSERARKLVMLREEKQKTVNVPKVLADTALFAADTALSATGAKAAIKAGKPAAKKVFKEAVKRSGQRAGIGAGFGAGTSISEGERDVKQIAKQAGISAAANVALGGVIDVAPKVISKGAKAIQTALEQPKFKPGFASTKPKVGLEQKQPKTEAPVVKLATTGLKQPKITAKPDELARETIQKAVKEPISQEIAPVARVSEKADAKVNPEPKIEAKKVIETSIDPTDPFGNRNRINQIRNELGSLVDTDYKMLKTLRKIEKETGAKGLVDQWDFDTGNIRASKAMANAKIRQSQELSDVLSGLNKKQAQNFDEYIKARAELENYTPEMKTSKPREELARIVAAGDAEFADRFSSVNQYYKNMAQDMYEGGLIDQNTLNRYLADDNYVRLQRDVEDLVGAMPGKSGSRSIRTTTAKQKRTGSERELLSPTQSLLKRTQQIELEIQRNKAANNIIDTLVEYGLATPVKTSKNKNTIARLVNGKKELFEVNGEIKQIIDNVNPYNLGVLAQIVSVPTRIFRAGTTALSAPFSVINYLRDQASSAIYSKNTLATHNPVNIITGLSNAVSDQVKGNKSPLWQKFERYIGDQTVYDELRNTANSNRLLRETREGQVGRFKNAILDPIRTIEDINSITEKATRFQNFEGIYKNAIKKGLPEEEAIKEAVLAARRNSVDFNKGGDFTRVVNLFIPYFNASVQGTRNVVQSFAQRPFGTAMKSIGFVALPSVIATAYNLSDETRKEAYNSINEFEKENNFIIIGPDAKQNEQGTWTGIYKIPKPQGYKELTDPVRDVTEAFLQGESVDNVGKMFYDMLGAVSGPFNIQSPEKFLGSIIPQAIKPTIQAGLNKDIFTGKQIVPQYMVEQTNDPTKRAFEGTSGSTRLVAEQLGVSPLQVEKFVKGTTGSLGQYATDLLDRALANAGIISKEQIGGKNIIEDVKRRLTEASGELLENKKTPGQKYFESVAEVKKDLSAQDQKAWDTLHPTKTNFLGKEIFDENKRISKYTKAGIYLNNPNVLEADRKLNQLIVQKGNPSNPFFELPEPLQRQVLLKEALPPGSKDPILSALYKEEWFQDYQKARSDYYEQVKTNMAKQGKELPKSTNPHPTTPPELQKVMDYYSSLPKGTGERSQWIKANPGLWQQMIAQWQQVDAWENKERVAMGIPEIVQEDTTKKAGSGKVGKKGKTLKIKGSLPIVELKARPKLAAIKLKRKATAPAIKLAPSRKAKLKKLTIRNIRVK